MNFQNCLASRLPPIGTVDGPIFGAKTHNEKLPMAGPFMALTGMLQKIVKKGFKKSYIYIYSWWFQPHLKKKYSQFGNLFPNYRDENKKSLEFPPVPPEKSDHPPVRRHFLRRLLGQGGHLGGKAP